MSIRDTINNWVDSFKISYRNNPLQEYELNRDIRESTDLSYLDKAEKKVRVVRAGDVVFDVDGNPMGIALDSDKLDKDKEVWDKITSDSPLEKIVEYLKRKHEERMTKKLFEDDNHVLHTGMKIGSEYDEWHNNPGLDIDREYRYVERGGKTSGNTIVFDIDGVIAGRTTDGDYSKAEPLTYGIEQVNKVYYEGYHVILYTARYGDRERGNVNRQYNRGYVELINWLDKHGVQRHEVYMGKPAAMLYVDDKASRVFKDDEEGWEVFWSDVDELSRRDKYGNYILADELEDEENDVPMEVVVIKSFWQKLKDWFNG